MNNIKEKAKFYENIRKEIPTKDFSFGDFTLTAKIPTLFEESKILLKRLDIFKKALEFDEDFKKYLLSSKIKQVDIDQNGNTQIKEVEFDYQNPQHVEYAYNSLIGNELREIFNRLAYLDVVVKEIKFKDKVLDAKFSEIFFLQPATKVHLRDIFSISGEILNWINEVNDVDPFLLKN